MPKKSEQWHCWHVSGSWEMNNDPYRCFWNQRGNWVAQKERARTIDLAFQRKYPDMPGDDAYSIQCDQP